MMYRYSIHVLTLLYIGISFWTGCSVSPDIADSGSGVGTGNPVIMGIILHADGSPASQVTVKLRRNNFLKDTSLALCKETAVDSADTVTDDAGAFRFLSIDTGDYTIEATRGVSFGVLVDCHISPSDSIIVIRDAVLAPLQRITGTLSLYGGPQVPSYIQIYGLDRVIKVEAAGVFEIAVPDGEYILRAISGDTTYSPVVIPNVQPNRDMTITILSDYPVSTDYTCDSLILRAILDSNNLQTLSVDSISEIFNSRIEEIELHGISFVTLPSLIGGMRALRDIDIQGTLFTSLPSRFGELVDVIDLNLCNNQLTTLPLEITNLINIEELDLSYNRLRNLLPAVKDWADRFDPDWVDTQDTTAVIR